MTSGVYPRKPDAKPGRKPIFSAEQVARIRAQKKARHSTKFLSTLWGVGIETIRDVIYGRNAYKDMQ